MGGPEFYKYLPARFENARKFTYENISMLGSTYECEQMFAVMNGNKSPFRNWINNAHIGSI